MTGLLEISDELGIYIHLFDVLDTATLSVFVYCVLTVTLLVFPQMFGHPVISTSSTTYVWMLSTERKEGLDSSWKETAIKKTQAHIHTHPGLFYKEIHILHLSSLKYSLA